MLSYDMCVDHYYEQVPLWSRIPHIYDINISFTSEVQMGQTDRPLRALKILGLVGSLIEQCPLRGDESVREYKRGQNYSRAEVATRPNVRNP